MPRCVVVFHRRTVGKFADLHPVRSIVRTKEFPRNGGIRLLRVHRVRQRHCNVLQRMRHLNLDPAIRIRIGRRPMIAVIAIERPPCVVCIDLIDGGRADRAALIIVGLQQRYEI